MKLYDVLLAICCSRSSLRCSCSLGTAVDMQIDMSNNTITLKHSDSLRLFPSPSEINLHEIHPTTEMRKQWPIKVGRIKKLYQVSGERIKDKDLMDTHTNYKRDILKKLTPLNQIITYWASKAKSWACYTWTRVDDTMKPLKSKSMSFQWAWRNLNLI